MIHSKSHNHHGKVSTAWLTLMLVLGLFAFSSGLNVTGPREKTSQKTEQIVSARANGKRAVSYARAFAQFQQGIGYDFRQSEFHLLACFHNLIFKTRTDQISRQVSSFQKPTRFFQRKTLPQNPDEDLFISIRG